MKSAWKKTVCFVALFSLLIPFYTQKANAATTTITNGEYYIIQNVYSGDFLAVEDVFPESGSNVHQFVYNGGTSQQFLIMPAENGINASSDYHQLAPKSDTTLRLDVSNAANSDGANIKLFVSNGGYGAQSFKFISNGDGSFRIMPHLSSTRVLSVAYNDEDDPDNVQLSTWTQHNSQRWVFKKVDHYVDINFFYPFRGTAATTYRTVTTRFSQSHIGIDVAAPDGTALYSPCNGTVIARGWEDSMGNYVIIRSTATDSNGKPLTIRIMHLNASPLVAANSTITSTTMIGYVGNTGTSYGAHLHIDINNKNYTVGDNIRDDFSSAVQPELLLEEVLFNYTSGYTYV